MGRLLKLALCLLVWQSESACRQERPAATADQIVAAERGALDRWGKGDPQGYLDVYAPDVTYFDPFAPARIDGHQAIEKMLEPIKGKVALSRYDMLNAKVQFHGDAAVLTYNLVSYARGPDGVERAVAHWNSTAVYARGGETWKIVHAHWSFTKPDLAVPNPEMGQVSGS